MDLATLIGVVAGLIFMLTSVIIGRDGAAGLKYFLDAPSAMITFGGAFAAIFGGTSIKDFVNGLKSAKIAFMHGSEDPGAIIQKIIDLSNVARKEGLPYVPHWIDLLSSVLWRRDPRFRA